MKMFVVRRYWNMDSEIFAVMHICIYAYDCVYICIVCVWSRITQWHTWTMLLRLHFAEAFGSSQFRGKNVVRSRLFVFFVCFLMAFSQMNDRLLETERKFDLDGLRVFSSSVVRCFYRLVLFELYRRILLFLSVFAWEKCSFRWFFAAIVEITWFPSRSRRSFALYMLLRLSLSLRAYELSLCDLPLSRMNPVPLQNMNSLPSYFLLCSA